MKIDKKNIFFSLFLFALILIKVSAFHTYFHSEDSNVSIENCATCDLAIENQQSQFTDIGLIDPHININFDFPIKDDHFISIVMIAQNEPSYYHQNRPPPAV